MINSAELKNAIISGAMNMEKHSEEVNSLNVFPVPDGDTGTNLALTMAGCAKAVSQCPDMGAGALADYAAGELLRCARGNSGVIFSLIFKGFAQSVCGLDYIDAFSLAKGLEAGCNEAYAAIDKPTEGTILTVIRIAASKALSAAQKGKGTRETCAAALAGAKASLKSTPNLLPILKKHGVVDAGGQGLVYILEGMLRIDDDNPGYSAATKDIAPKALPESDDADISFIYCTEFIINGGGKRDVSPLRRFLADIGDCPAVAYHSGIIKVHVHTNKPDLAIGKGLEYGELANIKIDNMRIQSAKKAADCCRMISLCSGAGVKAIMEASDGVIALECSGSMNASAGDILETVEKCTSQNIIISPNNKNTVLAAKRAAELSKKSIFINSAKTIPEGIACADIFDPRLTPERNIEAMDGACKKVISGAVTYAARSGSFGKKSFIQGQAIGLDGDKIICSGEDNVQTAVRVISSMLKKAKKGKIILVGGKDSNADDSEKIKLSIQNKFNKATIETVYGGQPLYYYIISAE